MPHKEITVKYELLPRYPGMFLRDKVVWDAFVARHPKRFFNVTYDVLVGKPEEMEVEVSPQAAAAWTDLTRWRIDVVAEDGDAVWVIEIKPNANAKALGQALAYSALLAKEFHTDKPIRPMVVTDRCSSITKVVAKEMGVALIEV